MKLNELKSVEPGIVFSLAKEPCFCCSDDPTTVNVTIKWWEWEYDETGFGGTTVQREAQYPCQWLGSGCGWTYVGSTKGCWSLDPHGYGVIVIHVVVYCEGEFAYRIPDANGSVVPEGMTLVHVSLPEYIHFWKLVNGSEITCATVGNLPDRWDESGYDPDAGWFEVSIP